MISEDLHTGLRVRVEGRLETQLRDPDLVEEGFDRSDEIPEAQIVIGNQSLHLMEFAQVRRVHGFVPEDAIDGKVPGRGESTWLIREFVQHLRRYRRCVRAQQVLEGLGPLKVVPVTDRSGPAHLVHLLDAFVIRPRYRHRFGRFLDEERIVRIACGVRLRLEERIEIPERTLHPLVRGHFGESHLHEDLAEFGPYLEEWVQVPAPHRGPERVEIERFEFRGLPRPAVQHFLGQVGGPLDAGRRVRRPPRDPVGLDRLDIHQFAAF